MEHDAEEVMRRIARQVAGQSGAEPVPALSESHAVCPAVGPARASALSVKSEYTLAELLAQRDVTFVMTAFEVVLKRRPSEADARDYLAALRGGSLNRVELLGLLRWSQEGIARGTHIDGLLVPYTLRRWSQRPWGALVGWVRSFVRMHVLFDRAEMESAAISHEVTELTEQTRGALDHIEKRVHGVDVAVRGMSEVRERMALAEVLQGQVEDMRSGLDQLAGETRGAFAHIEQRLHAAGEAVLPVVAALDEQVQEVRAKVEQFADATRGTLERVQERVGGVGEAVQALSAWRESLPTVAPLELQVHEVRAELTRRSDEARGAFEQIDGRVRALQAAVQTLGALQDSVSVVASLEAQIKQMDSRLESLVGADEAIENRIGLLEHRVVAHGAVIEQSRRKSDARNDATRALDPLYVAFEAAFRGPEHVIRERLAPYIELICGSGAGTSERPILDIGCGGGEWLQLLKDRGLVADGIDMNRLFVELCRGRGLSVELADALEALAQLPENSRGAITALHVAEHLPFRQLIDLIDESRRVLAPGGLVILETPNPENLHVGSHTFYLDPTHRNPLPPEMLRWIVSARGFMDVRIERLTTARDLPVPARADEAAPGAEAINAFVSLVGAAPDYAIVGRKP